MRTKKELMDRFMDLSKDAEPQILLEVLIDIRDILDNMHSEMLEDKYK